MLFTNKIYRPVAFFFFLLLLLNLSLKKHQVLSLILFFFFYFKPCSFRNRSLNLFYINPLQKNKNLKKKVKYKDDQCKIRLIYNNTLIQTTTKKNRIFSKKQVDVVERLVSIFVAK